LATGANPLKMILSQKPVGQQNLFYFGTLLGSIFKVTFSINYCFCKSHLSIQKNKYLAKTTNDGILVYLMFAISLSDTSQ